MHFRVCRRDGFALSAIVAFAIVSGSPAQAQDGDDSSPYLEALKACQAEPEPTARLACFDKAATQIVSAADAGEVRVVDREQVRKTRRGLFGFSIPDLGIFGKRSGDEADEDKIEELETTVAAVSGSFNTGYTIRTAEGAVWNISDVPRRLKSPKAGDKLLIKSGALSAYYIRINEQGGVKAVRIR